MINETMARKFFANRNPLSASDRIRGRRLGVKADIEIVGVVRDSKGAARATRRSRSCMRAGSRFQASAN